MPRAASITGDEGGSVSEIEASRTARGFELPARRPGRARADEDAAAASDADDARFAAIVAANDDRLRALAYHLLDSREAMDDVLQDVYLKAFSGLAAFRGDSALATWLYRITYTTCMDRIRRAPRTVRLSSETIERVASATEALDERVARIDQLHRALSALDPGQCAAVLLVLRDGHSYDDAAEILGVPRGTVASRVSAARRRLSELLSADRQKAGRP
jgi:RNA polymerase sigma-70 factor (ECF subfamily)